MNNVIISYKNEVLNMNFFKKFFCHDNTIIGLSGLRKKQEYVKITVPESYKKTLIINTEQNYLLF